MTALVRTRGLADSLAELFDPVDTAPIEALIAEHRGHAATITRLAAVFASEEAKAALPYLIKGADIRSESYSVERMFAAEQVARAHKALDAAYWQRALDATDVLSVMPAKRRGEWRKQISELDVPPFTDAALRSTLAEHLAARHTYFAERVDGLFQRLSPNHKTNLASGFRSKMILTGVTEMWGASDRVDTVVDLRVVVARFMGRADLGDGSYTMHDLTRKVVEYGRRQCTGEWITVDGGAIELRLYKNGNCHIRVHDEIAWRLNAVLASVHPGAIPESNRTRPAHTGQRAKKASPSPMLYTRPLPFPVLQVLAGYNTRERDLAPGEWAPEWGTWRDADKHVRREALTVLAGLGAVESSPAREGRVRFDYAAGPVLRWLVASGCVPDQQAHQYYPTPRVLAERLVDLAAIGPNDVVLEPSAGQGAIADLLPRDRTICIEASALHCEVLRAKGFDVIERDFLAIPYFGERRPTVAVMNPPFDRGQWMAHVEHAAHLLASMPTDLLRTDRGIGARLVAILPASAPAKLDLPGYNLTWSEPIEGAFPGTSIGVVILVAEREA